MNRVETHGQRGVIRTLIALSLAGGLLSGCGANFISTEREIALGEQAAPQFLSEGGGAIPDPLVMKYVSEVGRKVLAAVPDEERRDLPWEFHVLNSQVLNAFALPGGKVFISRGLMVKLSNEAELAAVLGHEVGHVIHEHIGKQMTHQAVQSTVINVAVGAAGQMSDSQWISVLGAGAETGGQLYLLSFGREQELEADEAGLRLMVRAGYDPRGLLGVLRVLQEASGTAGGLEILSTHPHPENRVAQAEELISTRYAGAVNNPQYVLGPEAYQSKALGPLSRLPPPADAEPAAE